MRSIYDKPVLTAVLFILLVFICKIIIKNIRNNTEINNPTNLIILNNPGCSADEDSPIIFNLGFKDANNKDYHIESNSGLIDMGISIDPYPFIPIPTTDYDGNHRPVGASTDIGPYEYQ